MVDLPLNYKDFRPIMLGVLDSDGDCPPYHRLIMLSLRQVLRLLLLACRSSRLAQTATLLANDPTRMSS